MYIIYKIQKIPIKKSNKKAQKSGKRGKHNFNLIATKEKTLNFLSTKK